MLEPLPFSRWLKRLRTDHDLTQDALAEEVGCSTQTIRMYESGGRRPSRAVAERLAQVLQLPPPERDAFVRVARTRDAASLSEGGGAAVDAPTPHPTSPSPAAAPSKDRPPLPVPPNALIGREHEHHLIRAALLHPQQRLITVLGPGGIGKTRLALQVAHDLAPHFPDGVAWVALASVARLEDVPTTVADALGLTLHGMQPARDHILNYLRPRQMLVVLDNLEHLLAGTPLVDAVLEHAPQVTVLATSRERLRVAGEWVVELDGLSLPDDTAELLERAAAVLLFAERARQMHQGFALTPANQRAVAEICCLLHGLPLGIELAAAWMRTLTPREIADEIAGSLDFLSLTERAGSGRHQSLRAVFEHSWRLLPADEQAVLSRLAVFGGGWHRQAAQAVAGASLPNLASLVDKSLLRRNADGRYDLHPLVQQYARAKLHEDVQAEHATQDRHCAYYAGFVHEQFGVLQGAAQRTARDRLNQEIDNIRAAWSWAVATERLGDLERMADTLLQFFELRDWLAVGERFFGETADRLREQEAVHQQDATNAAQRRRVVGRLWAYALYYAVRLGNIEHTPEPLAHVIALLESVHDRWGLAAAHSTAGILDFFGGNYATAHQHLITSITAAEAVGYTWFAIGSCITLGINAQTAGQLAEAQPWYEAAVSQARKLGNRFLLNGALAYYGKLLAAIGAFDAAQAVLRESLSLADNSYAYNVTLHHLGAVALAQGRPAEALPMLEQSLQVWRQQHNDHEILRILSVLGDTLVALDQPEQARVAYREALAMGVARNLLQWALVALVGLAHLAQHADPQRSRAWAAYALAHPTSSDEARERAKQVLATLGDDATESEAMIGTNGTLPPLEQIVAAALRT